MGAALAHQLSALEAVCGEDIMKVFALLYHDVVDSGQFESSVFQARMPRSINSAGTSLRPPWRRSIQLGPGFRSHTACSHLMMAARMKGLRHDRNPSTNSHP